MTHADLPIRHAAAPAASDPSEDAPGEPDAPRSRPPLVVAAHGTRDAAGVEAAHALVRRVRGLLPGVRVEPGFVELTPPTIAESLAAVVESVPAAVVVPLMIGAGGHARDDIPAAIADGRREHPEATVVYTRHLGAARPLVEQALARIDEARGAWTPEQTSVILVGRGCSVTDANADHVRLARVLEERGGYAVVWPAFVQVARPGLPQALDAARRAGATRIVVMPHFLFPGRLEGWTRSLSHDFATAHPEVDVRVAGVLGPGEALAEVVAQRYREGERAARVQPETPTYLTGLLLSGRRVVAVGGGCVNRRRVPKLLAGGAEVTVIAPTLHPALAELAEAGTITWRARGYEPGDLDGAWFVLAATDSPETNARVAAEAEAGHTFCVRADKAECGSAWTPATGRLHGAQIAVLSDHDPQHSKRLRDRIVTEMEH